MLEDFSSGREAVLFCSSLLVLSDVDTKAVVARSSYSQQFFHNRFYANPRVVNSDNQLPTIRSSVNLIHTFFVAIFHGCS